MMSWEKAILVVAIVVGIVAVTLFLADDGPCPELPQQECPGYTDPSVEEIAAAKILLEKRLEAELKASVVFTEDERAEIRQHYIDVTLAMDALRKRGLSTREITGA